MSPACYRHFVLRRDHRQVQGVALAEITARVVFEAIMSAPDLPAERRPADTPVANEYDSSDQESPPED